MDEQSDEPRPTLALVDDSEEVRTLVRTRLELSGMFEIVGEGSDGADAIGLAYRHEPTIILLDTSMPTMDGLEALPAILTLSPYTRVVMFTGFGERGLADRARELGAADFVEKSVPIEDLPDRLRRVLDDGRPVEPRPRRGLRAVDGVRTQDPSVARDQAALEEHLERFRELFDKAAIGMATLTLNGSVVRANPALAKMMDCEPADLVGVDYGQLTSGHGDDLDETLKTITSVGGLPMSFEHPLPDGGARIVRATLAPIRDSKGQALYVFAQVQDVSAQRYAEDQLRHSEERFRLIVTAVMEYAIFMLDPEGHVVSWNGGAERIKGYSAEEIMGQHFRVFYPPEERAAHHPERNLERARRDGSYAEEGWRLRKDGSRFWASVVITAVCSDDGRLLGFTKVTRDHTAQREYEEERQRAGEQQRHLLAVTAHELRTPTAVIEGSSSMLRDHWGGLVERDRAELLAAIGTSAHRLQRLVSDMAAASRAQADTLRLYREPVSLRTALATAVERIRAANSGVQVALDLDRDVTVEVDENRLGQAIDNLLENAVRHGRPPVTLRGRITPGGVRIAVSDHGAGVAPDLLPRLFERFAIAGPTGGTGLGLYLVREILRGHGGEAEYEPGSADRPPAFVLTLPASAISA